MQTTLDSLLERRLCRSLEASSSDLWTLPTLGVPDHVLRNHANDVSVRALYAFLGSRIFSSLTQSVIAQTFSSYSAHVRLIIVSQMSNPTVLSRMASRLPLYAHKVPAARGESDPPKVQLLYAAVSALAERHGEDHVAEWLKTLVGNLVPVIMEAVADWEDMESEQGGLTGFDDDLAKSEPLDPELGETDMMAFLARHLHDLGPIDEEH